MQTGNFQVFSSASSNTSAWFRISDYSSWSLEAVGLETGGTLAVMLSNANPLNPPTAAPGTANGEAGAGLPLNTPATYNDSGASVGTITPTSTFFFGPGAAQWLQIVKTPGGAPTVTTVRLFGQIS